MQQLIKIVRGIFSVIEKVFEVASMIMLVAMTAIICYQVVMRYVFNNAPSWSEEVALILMIWFGILSIPIGVRLHLHIGIEYVFKKFPIKFQWIFSRVIYLLITAFGMVMVVSGFQLVQFMSMSTMPATKLPSSVKYAVIPLAGITLVYNALELFFISYKRYLEEGDDITDVVM